MPLNIAVDIAKLKLDFNGKINAVSCTLDDLFRGYMENIPLLSITTRQCVIHSPFLLISSASFGFEGLRYPLWI